MGFFKFKNVGVGLAAASIVGIGALVVLSRFCVIIPVGKVGVVETFGKVSETTLGPGIYLQNPLSNVIQFSTQTREVKETAEVPSKDGLVVTVDMSILYRLDPSKVKQLYETVGTEYEGVVLVPQARSLMRSATASYEAQTLYTSQRQALSQQLQRSLSQQVALRGVIVEEALLRNVVLPESIQKSVQQKLQAEQDSQRMEFVIQKERKEAERKRIEAQGVADSQRIISQGLTDKVLQFRQIEATEKLAQSQNAKIVIVGDSKAPLNLQP
ncbi:prohibitin family protein [Leptolyngbya sp. FACHB-36]|uniref:prohibitin family protein n=1 Tax=Leptolyngbya sp. FACHB-36 TaxID=2692808 RepID=UPI0016803A03|nr:prohibitin family protein [Leptolyngbya sp. FACHB-36]MBD2019445.1 prohibitin family protein [Leptolyngbya sp. FACHB-36]